MEKLKQAAKNHWFKMAAMGFFATCTLLYHQQNEIIAGQGEDIKLACKEMNKRIDGKVNNDTLKEMIQTINVKLEHDAEKWEGQNEFNQEVQRNMKTMNESIIILNERMKTQ